VKRFTFIFSMIMIGGCLLTSRALAQSSQLKIGYVDSQVILNQMPEAIKAQGDLDSYTNKWTAQLDSMNNALQAAYQDYQKKADKLSDDKKLTIQKSLIQKQQDMENFRREKFAQQTGEIYKLNDSLFAPIKKKIYAAIQDVAKENNMQYVLDKSGDVIVLYADPQFDVTYQVLDKLKRGKF
jgi:outer membrane protein